ncbi:MAG: hypothetical protein JRF33_22980 [Deltaproteobacteria bacterium]|nr:hypothetical protein [Deltaproteobacteria bacterium]
MKFLGILLVLLFSSGFACCGASRRAIDYMASPECVAPKGDPSQMRTPIGEMMLFGYRLRIEGPQPCGVGQGKSFMVEGEGKRRFIHRHLEWKKLCEGKDKVPGDCTQLCEGRPMPDETCRFVRAMDFASEVRQKMQAAGHLASVGLAACGERFEQAGYGQITLIVHDWAAVDLAIQTLADRMRAWRIGDQMRLAVKPIICGTPVAE